MGKVTPVAIIAALIALNGIFVAAEFAIIGTPLVSVERRAAKGNRIARRVVSILRDPRRQDQYIATAQLGITFASLGLGMYGEHVVAEWFAQIFALLGSSHWFPEHAAATVVAVALLTYLHIVLGEMVPKALALQHAERTCLWITPPVLWVKTALYPLVIGLNSLGNSILRIFGVDRQATSRHHGQTSEELEYLISESQAGGALQGDTGKLLRELLRFSELTAEEVMVPRVRVAGIPLGASSSDLSPLLRNSSYTRLPVYRQDLDEILGVIHVKELLPKLLHEGVVGEPDVRPVPFVPHTAKVDTVLAAMRRDQAQMAVVMDEHGGTAGIITAKDLLDEVVGEMHEDARTSELRFDEQGRLHVAGTVRLEEVGEHLKVGLEHEEVETVGGLVLSLLERPPKVGDSVVYKHLRIDVTEIAGHGVKTCIISQGEPERGV
ncbi:MAG: HlyC/CorC family transporter [Acidobacteria bacterium]|nr:HlyC/CorC family transporter [Acidobacteriota bacterium]